MANITDSHYDALSISTHDIPNMLYKTKPTKTKETTSITNESTGHNLVSFESNASNKQNGLHSEFLHDIANGVKGRPACCTTCSEKKTNFDEDLAKIGINPMNLMKCSEMKEVKCSQVNKKEDKPVASKSRQAKFKINDGLTVALKTVQKKHWEELDTSFKCPNGGNPLYTFFKKKKASIYKQTPTDQLKKAISSLKSEKAQSNHLEGKKRDAYLNILNLIYTNHIKKK